MEMEVSDYVATLAKGRPHGEKRNTWLRRLRPLDRLLLRKKGVRGKSDKNDPWKNEKAARRKSGTSSDVPSNYDSCDDPSQDHRTEPTTSVDSVLGWSSSIRCKQRPPKRSKGIVPTLWHNDFASGRRTSSDQAKEAMPFHRYDYDGESGCFHPRPMSLPRISSCPASSYPTIKESAEEGVELILREKKEPQGKSLKSHIEDDISRHLRHNERAERQINREILSLSASSAIRSDDLELAVTSPRPPSSTGEYFVVETQCSQKISLTSESVAQEIEHHSSERATEAQISRPDSDQGLHQTDSRPLKEIVFVAKDGQFDDMDDLTLPPTSFTPVRQRAPTRPLYSRPITPLGFGSSFNLVQSFAAKSKSSSTKRLPKLQKAPSIDKDVGNDEMFATFVEERHGSFQQIVLSTQNSNNPPLDRAYDCVHDGPVSTTELKPYFAEYDGFQNTRNRSESMESEDDLEVSTINKNIPESSVVSLSQDDTDQNTTSELVGLNPSTIQSADAPSGRSSRSSRLGSLFSFLEPGTHLRATISEEHHKHQILAPDPTFDTSERVDSSQDNMKPSPTPTQSKMECESNPQSLAPTDCETSKPNEKECIDSHVQSPIAHVVSHGADESAATTSDSGFLTVKEPELFGEYSFTYSDDSLTRDSLMEILDLQAAASGDAESALWLARRQPQGLLRSDLMIRHCVSDDNSTLSGADSSLARRTPLFKAFDCGGLNAYTSSIDDEESFASTGVDDNIITELKADLFNTVNELKREGSFVVSRLIRQLSNQN